MTMQDELRGPPFYHFEAADHIDQLERDLRTQVVRGARRVSQLEADKAELLDWTEKVQALLTNDSLGIVALGDATHNIVKHLEVLLAKHKRESCPTK